jgi:Na+/melibiose symporter-like transporter
LIRNTVKKRGLILVFVITSIFPLLLALVSCCLTEKKYNSNDTDADIVKTGETLKEFGQFVA